LPKNLSSRGSQARTYQGRADHSAEEDGTAPSRGLRAVNATGVRGELISILREAIWDGRLKPGERLFEPKLAAELGVSRPPLREALTVLEADGLVKSIRNRGTFVRVLTGSDVREICTLEIALESLAVRLIIEQGHADSARELEVRLAETEEAVRTSSIAERIARDFAFHRALVRLGGNSRLLDAWERLVGELRLALSVIDPIYFEEAFLAATHRPIVDAIKRTDAEAAIEGISNVILPVREALSARWSELSKELQ
jgi:DNA-binding GntR family transcriptional regulator